jgi:hypothetical protein
MNLNKQLKTNLIFNYSDFISSFSIFASSWSGGGGGVELAGTGCRFSSAAASSAGTKLADYASESYDRELKSFHAFIFISMFSFSKHSPTRPLSC